VTQLARQPDSTGGVWQMSIKISRGRRVIWRRTRLPPVLLRQRDTAEQATQLRLPGGHPTTIVRLY
jgi:hypothetical protein